MKFAKLTLVATLAAAFSVSAFAQDKGRDTSNITSNTSIANTLTVTGSATVNGAINVLSESAAVVESHQNSGSTVSPSAPPTATGGVSTDPNWANLTSGAGNNAQGNIGVNVAAGAANIQSNDVALAAVDADRVFASASTFSTQRSTARLTSVDQGYNNAAIDNALSGARGNVSVNVAAGEGNLQDNQLAVSVNGSGTLAKATGANNQTSTATITTGSGSTNVAGLGNGALSCAQGNIGASVAAGQGNLQHNSLSIAVATR